MREFEMDGILYRTNADASKVEARDPHGWHVTGSLRVIMYARALVVLAPAAPAFCPRCGTRGRLLQVSTWRAHSEDDPENVASLDEYQCLDTCGGRSFWL